MEWQTLLIILGVSFFAPIAGALIGNALNRAGPAPASTRAFWILYVVAWALFAVLVGTNGQMVTEASPNGILDHQVAGTAARVKEIQDAWAAAGSLDAARMSMGLDLVYIGVLTAAGVTGGRYVARASGNALAGGLGWLTLVAFLVFGAADYAETISQIIQALNQPDDTLAHVAQTANGPKGLAFLAGHVLLGMGLLGAGLTRGKA